MAEMDSTELLQQLIQRGFISQADSKGLSGADQSAESQIDALVGSGLLTGHQAIEIKAGGIAGLAIGQYIIQQPLGRGGMGVVYLAKHQTLNKEVAIKVLPEEASNDRQQRSRFQREMETLARLSHPHIAATFDGGEDNGRLYFVMEYLSGGTLADRLSQGPLPIDEVVDRISETCEAIEYAHGLGIVHRDLKPSNLGIDKFGKVKVLDLGLAQITCDGDGLATTVERITRDGQVLGTIDFMAPEQARSSRGSDHRVDLYSLGCTLYSLLTGRPPFPGDSVMDKVEAHRSKSPPALRKHRPDVPLELENLFRWMVAKLPSDRPQSAAIVHKRLREIDSQRVTVDTPLATLAGGLAHPQSSSLSQSVVQRSNVTLWLSIIAMILAALTLGIAVSSRFNDEARERQTPAGISGLGPHASEADSGKSDPINDQPAVEKEITAFLDWAETSGSDVFLVDSEGQETRWFGEPSVTDVEQRVSRVVLRGVLNKTTPVEVIENFAKLESVEFDNADMSDQFFSALRFPATLTSITFRQTPVTLGGLVSMGPPSGLKSVVFDQAGLTDEFVLDLNEWSPRLTHLQLTGNQLSPLGANGIRPTRSLRSIVCDSMLLDANSTRWFAELARLRNLTLVGEPAPGSLESIHSLLQIGRLTVDASGLEGPAIDALLEIPWLRRVTLKNLRSPVLSIESLAASKSVQRIDLEDAVLSVDDVRWLQQLGGSKFWSWGATTAFETRRAATEVIRQGGRLEIATSNGMLNVDRVGAIPDEPFQIRSVVLSGESNSALPNLRGLFGIRKLQIQGPGIGDRHLRVIADLTSLTSLSVLDADCTNKGLASLASLVHLEKIDLRDLSGCTHVGLEQLFRATTKLTGIATNSIPLSDGCYQALEDDQELTSLIMHCHTGHETTDELFSSLVKLKKLKDLHLGTPGITGSRLGELEQCPDLLHLYLPRQIETDAIRELTRLPQLTVVGISDATPEKVKIVMHLPNLVELSVFGGELHDGDFKRIFKSRLQSIHLRNVDVDDQMVLEHVDSNSDLKSLTLNLTLASDQLASAVRDRLPNCEVKIIESRTEPHRHKSNRWARSINVPVLDLKRLSGLIQTQNWDALQTAADQQVEAIRSANPDGAESEVELEISKQLHQIADQLRVADYLRAETYFMEAAKHADLAIELEPTSEAFFRALQSWQMVSFARTRDRAVVGCLATLRLHLQSPPQGWMKEDLDDWFRCAAKVYRWRREFRDGELGDFSVDEMPGRIERWLDTFGSDTASAKDFERYFSVIDDYAWAVAELDCRRAADLAATGLQNWEVGLRRFESLNNYNPGFGGNAVRFYLMAGDSTSAQATSELNLRLLTKYFESNRGRWIEKWIASSLVASTLLDVFQGRRAEAEKSVQEMIAKGSATWTPTTRRDLIVLLGTVAPNELPENIANELLEGVDPKLDAATIFDLRLMVASLEADREKIDRLLDTETRTPTPLSRAIRFHVGRTLAGEDNAPKPDLSHSQDPTNWNTTVAICSARLVNGWDGMPLHVSWRRDTDAAKSDDTTGSAER